MKLNIKNRELLYIIAAGRRLFGNILSIREGTDAESTIAGIKKDITFRGHTAWILIFSIFIASIGLNVNSVAVIIGAMLISPLMGPILGIGLSVGTQDIETLFRSLKNLGIAVGISLFTSTLYFVLTPLKIEQTEILARTSPTILDVFIAFFGGLAGIVAGSRREKTNVIPGVAIATALMPPLCTAGYGLATLKFSYFFGAFYLFFINSVFISLSTFLVVKYLKFPVIGFISSEKMKKYKIIFIGFIILTITPSTIIFYKVIQETRFNISVEKFVSDHAMKFSGSELINKRVTFHDTLSTITLYYIGERLDDSRVAQLQDNLQYYNLSGSGWFPPTRKTIVRVQQPDSDMKGIERKFSEFNKNLRVKVLEDIYTKNEQVIKDKDKKILLLEDELMRLKERENVPFANIREEIRVQYSDVERIAYAKTVETNYGVPDSLVKIDTLPTFLINYSRGVSKSSKLKQNKMLGEWLKVRLNLDTLRVLEY